MAHRTKDETGKRYGFLSVKERAGTKKRLSTWLCVCDCGAEKEVAGADLRRGTVRSCGCMHWKMVADQNTTHGHTRGGKSSPTMKVWAGMLSRCYRPGCNGYERYGGRGIVVCESWHTFANFLADMGERPYGTQLDRVDPNGNYEPNNCRWVTPREQGNNRRNNVVVTAFGESMTIAQWSRRTGVPFRTIWGRLFSNKNKMTPEDCVSAPSVPPALRRSFRGGSNAAS